jgi:hypothetical protein
VVRDADPWRWDWQTGRPAAAASPGLKLPLASVPRRYHRLSGLTAPLHTLLVEVLAKVSRLEMAEDAARWLSLTQAARHIPLRRSEARTLLRASGLVQRLAGREVVWLPDLQDLARRLEEQADPRRRKRTRRAPKEASANDLVPIPAELLAG